MKRIVRLTESDLVKLVKRVIKEQSETTTNKVGPLMSLSEARQLMMLVNDNKKGVRFLDYTDNNKDSIKVVTPFTVRFTNPSGSDKTFARSPQGGIVVQYKQGDLLNLDETSEFGVPLYNEYRVYQIMDNSNSPIALNWADKKVKSGKLVAGDKNQTYLFKNAEDGIIIADMLMTPQFGSR